MNSIKRNINQTVVVKHAITFYKLGTKKKLIELTLVIYIIPRKLLFKYIV